MVGRVHGANLPETSGETSIQREAHSTTMHPEPHRGPGLAACCPSGRGCRCISRKSVSGVSRPRAARDGLGASRPNPLRDDWRRGPVGATADGVHRYRTDSVVKGVA
ncbi:hypothetical protein A3768_0838 [Ralstonia solanacearum]|nr:hypothetical protein A3768_0838 [Ralstonia solanacearum]